MPYRSSGQGSPARRWCSNLAKLTGALRRQVFPGRRDVREGELRREHLLRRRDPVALAVRIAPPLACAPVARIWWHATLTGGAHDRYDPSGATSRQCVAATSKHKQQAACEPPGHAVDFSLLTSGFAGFETLSFESEDGRLGAGAALNASTAAENLSKSRARAADELLARSRAADEQMDYVNLQQNPERYTGYTGYTATRIWDAIYLENCFMEQQGDDESECFEEVR